MRGPAAEGPERGEPTTAAGPAPSSVPPREMRARVGPDTQPTLSVPAAQVRAGAESQTPPTRPISPAQVRANAAAVRILRRLITGDSPPTAPLSIVDRLAGSPYANPTIQVGGVDESARRTLDFALLLAETMFRYGAGALEV